MEFGGFGIFLGGFEVLRRWDLLARMDSFLSGNGCLFEHLLSKRVECVHTTKKTKQVS